MDLMEIARERHLKNAFVVSNGIELVSLEPDRAVFQLLIGPNHKNPNGALHGGVYFTMADAAAGAAAGTDGRRYVTQHGDLHFLRGQSEGTVRAEARVRHRGRRTCLLEITVTGEEDRLLATGTMTYFCVSPAAEGSA